MLRKLSFLLLILSLNSYALTDAQLEECLTTHQEFKTAQVNFAGLYQYLETVDVDGINMSVAVIEKSRRKLLKSDSCDEATAIVQKVNNNVQQLIDSINKLFE
jgi:hypothetical protein